MIRTSLAGLTVLALSAPAMMSSSAYAHRLTDVLDAADGDNIIDFVGEVSWRRTLRRAKITRDFNCLPGRGLEAESCPSAPASGELLNVKELRYERIRHEITPRFRLGLWHDLELSITMPIVADDTQDIRFAGNGGKSDGIVVTGNNSTIAPDEGRQQLFPVPVPGLPSRSGFGDMEFMIRYAPISQQRDDQRGDWVLELGYRAPTGEVMKHGNTGVGRGVHELIVATALSRRFRYVDPYARIEAVFPFAASDSLFQDYGFAQEYTAPGIRGSFDFGAEFIPFEDTKQGFKFFIALGLGATYQAEGRDYSELFDALAIGSRSCSASASPQGYNNCAVYNQHSKSSVSGKGIDGITTVENFMQLRGSLALGAQLGPYFRLGIDLSLAHDTEHYLSNASIGKVIPHPEDGVGGGRVELTGDPRFDANEHNPTYSSAIDEPGRRLRVEETTIFGFGISAAATF